MKKAPEEYRIKDHPLFGSDESHGNNGAFIIPLDKFFKTTPHMKAFCMISDGFGWEHISVSIQNKKAGFERTPYWQEMCLIKDLFFEKEECVMQLHPKESEYVNNHPNCLHLWRPIDKEIPQPPAEMVGFKSKRS